MTDCDVEARLSSGLSETCFTDLKHHCDDNNRPKLKMAQREESILESFAGTKPR